MIVFIVFGVIAAVIFAEQFIYSLFAFKNLSCKYYFSKTEVTEGDIFYITEEIENRKYLPLPAVSTIVETGDCLNFADENGNILEQKNAFCFYTIGMYKKIVRTWRVKATKRGRVNVDKVTVTVKDVFGLVSMLNIFSCDSSVLVLPAEYNSRQAFDFTHSTGGTSPVLTGYYSDPFNIVKISDYTYSEPLNKINWKASAKNQRLMVNYEQPAVSARILIALDVSKKMHTEINIKICATLLRILPEDTEVKFIFNASVPENYSNILLMNKQGGYDNPKYKYIQTREFNFTSHQLNYKRILAEILEWSESDIDKCAEISEKSGFYDTIITVKGGAVHEAGQKIFI